MSQFYISIIDPDRDLQQCHQSRDTGTLITVAGADKDGCVAPYTGIVQSVEDKGPRAPARTRWRITMSAH